MAEPPSEPRGTPLLRGLFGSFQAGAAARARTEDIWSAIRGNAGSWLFAAQGVPQPWDPGALESAGREILRAQGVDAASVSRFRGVAGTWLGAKQSIHSIDPAQQLTAKEIFTPPWSTTASSAVPSRHRIRTQWQFQTQAGEQATVWKADELTAPLSSLQDALDQAQLKPNQTSPPMFALAAEPPVLTDWEIEQI